MLVRHSSGPWDSVKVQYAKEKSTPAITLTRIDSTYYLFSDKAQLVTDDAVSDLKLIDTYRNRHTDFRTRYTSSGVFEFTAAQIAGIQNAKKVELRLPFYNTNTITWKVSEKVLNEWKEMLTRSQSEVSSQNTPMDNNSHSAHHGGYK
ncbi:hypothetical protein SCACP_28400 [Sporomusa carbonis]|uniref:hypothetical protein n=1 Tax=Sporomusa carbonis TaxID=3076075 RepID=UPI003A647150